MGALPIVLMILAMKIPIFGLIWLTWWAGRAPAEADGADAPNRTEPRAPRPNLPLRPRRRGPHGGAAAPLPRRDRRRGTVPVP